MKQNKISESLDYLRLEEFQRLPRNVKEHDVGAIISSIEEFGFAEPVVVNKATGHILSGHGRMLALQSMKATNSVKVPMGVRVTGDNTWLVPVAYVSVPKEKEEALALALNRTGELGGWDNQALAELLADLAARDQLVGTGFDGDDLDRLLWELGKKTPTDVEKEYQDRAGRAGDGSVSDIPDQGDSDNRMVALVLKAAEHEEFMEIVRDWPWPDGSPTPTVADVVMEIIRYAQRSRNNPQS